MNMRASVSSDRRRDFLTKRGSMGNDLYRDYGQLYSLFFLSITSSREASGHNSRNLVIINI
jgi:hypothetical protein